MLLPKSNAWLVSFLMVSNRPTRCSEPLRFKVGGASKPSPWLCGMGPPGDNNLQFIVYSLQFTACWLKSVPSKVFAMVVRDGTARGKESL